MKCKRCQEEYEPQYWNVLGTKILRGDGYCPDCAEAVYEEQHTKASAKAGLEIKGVRSKRTTSSGIPPKFLTESFSSFDKGWQDVALAFCQKYADDFPIGKRPIGYPSLYLWSTKSWGTGKTHLSCAIALRILERWNGEGIDYEYTIGDDARLGGITCPRIYFVSESDLFRQIQATYSFTREDQQSRDSEDDIIRKLIHCDLLILDDVGKERRADSRFVQRTLFGLIDGRYKLQLPMVLTANVNADGLKAHLEDASFDRFFEMIGGKSVCMDGESYRRR